MAAASDNESAWSSVPYDYDGVDNIENDFVDALNRYGLSMTTSQMSTYLMENGTFVCHNHYNDNDECAECARRIAAGNQDYTQHSWYKGSSFQVFAQT